VTVGVDADNPLPELGSVWMGSGGRVAGDAAGTGAAVATGRFVCGDGTSRLGAGTVVGGAGGTLLRAGGAGVTVFVAAGLPGAAAFDDGTDDV
jgi:hypothetical protein